MKRVSLHLAYWFSYLSLCVLLEYLWLRTIVGDVSVIRLMPEMFASVFLATIPEILFAYYLMYIGFRRFVQRSVPVGIFVLEVALLMTIAAIASRCIQFYLYRDVMYGGKLAQDQLFELGMLLRSVIFLGFSTGLALALKSLRYQIAVKEREKNLVKEKLSTELRMLRSQLHPHFLFNTLNNIYALTRKKSDQAPEAVMKLSELLSFILYESSRETISLAQEIQFLEDFIDLEKIRYSNRLSISFEKKIEDPAATIVPLLLLPLVENAFKHGGSETRFDAHITMSIMQQGNQFRFYIENSVEQDRSIISKGKIGLNNIKRQLELVYSEQEIEVTEKENLFAVNLSINLDSYGKIYVPGSGR